MCEKERRLITISIYFTPLCRVESYSVVHSVPPMKGSDDIAERVIRISIQIMMEVKELLFFTLSILFLV